MKRFSLCFLCCIFYASVLPANLLYDILDGKYRPTPAPECVSLPDGEHYAQLVDGKQIFVYDYKTGNITDTLFDATTTKITKLDSIDGFLLDPQGKRLLVYCNKQQLYRRTFSAHYYLLDLRRNELKPLTDEQPIRVPLFSPDGRYIAFARNNNLYIHKADFGTEVAVTTDGENGKIINGTPDWLYEEEFEATQLFAWSPDSKQLAFVRFNESDVPQFTFQQFTNGKGESNLYPENKTLKYPKAGEPNAQVSVCVYDTYYKSVKTMQINEDKKEIYVPYIRWTQDNNQLAIFKFNRNQDKLEMLFANPKSTICQRIYTENGDNYFVDYQQIFDYQFLSDNRFIAVNESNGYRHAYLYSPTGMLQKQLTQGNFDITQVYGYDEATQTLYYQAAAESPLVRNIYALNLKKGKTTCLTPEKGTHNAHFSANFSYFISTYSSLTVADQTNLYTNAGKRMRTLSDNKTTQAAFEELQLPQKEFFTFQTQRGDQLNGWILKPVDFDNNKKYPVLQVQYSGPGSQEVRDMWRIGWEYYLATQGFVVVCTDGRGTEARGTAFRKCTYTQLGTLETEDQVSTAHYLATLPYIDASRIGIWGWSYGGYMSLRCMSQAQQVFKAGIAVAPVTDFRFYDSAYTERYMRRPQENFKGYDDISLLGMTDKMNGNLLIVHGTADDNVHAQNMWLYINKLVEADKQFEMQIYPDDNHHLKKRNNYHHLFVRMTNFLLKNL